MTKGDLKVGDTVILNKKGTHPNKKAVITKISNKTFKMKYEDGKTTTGYLNFNRIKRISTKVKLNLSNHLNMKKVEILEAISEYDIDNRFSPFDYSKMLEAFNDYDSDKDGFVTRVEFMKLTKLSADEINELIETNDANKDGKISLTEYIKWCIDSDALLLWDKNKIIDAFIEYDSDNDGFMTRDEFMKLTKLSADEINELIETNDANKDGKISLKEYIKWCNDSDALLPWDPRKKVSKKIDFDSDALSAWDKNDDTSDSSTENKYNNISGSKSDFDDENSKKEESTEDKKSSLEEDDDDNVNDIYDNEEVTKDNLKEGDTVILNNNGTHPNKKGVITKISNKTFQMIYEDGTTTTGNLKFDRIKSISRKKGRNKRVKGNVNKPPFNKPPSTEYEDEEKDDFKVGTLVEYKNVQYNIRNKTKTGTYVLNTMKGKQALKGRGISKDELTIITGNELSDMESITSVDEGKKGSKKRVKGNVNKAPLSPPLAILMSSDDENYDDDKGEKVTKKRVKDNVNKAPLSPPLAILMSSDDENYDDDKGEKVTKKRVKDNVNKAPSSPPLAILMSSDDEGMIDSEHVWRNAESRPKNGDEIRIKTKDGYVRGFMHQGDPRKDNTSRSSHNYLVNQKNKTVINDKNGNAINVNGWKDGQIQIPVDVAKASPDLKSGTKMLPGELSTMLMNMSDDWATSDDELFAEDSSTELKFNSTLGTKYMTFADSSSDVDDMNMTFAPESSTTTNEKTSSDLEFAETSSDLGTSEMSFAGTSDSDQGHL